MLLVVIGGVYFDGKRDTSPNGELYGAELNNKEYRE
jgi:hypothetical protein